MCVTTSMQRAFALTHFEEPQKKVDERKARTHTGKKAAPCVRPKSQSRGQRVARASGARESERAGEKGKRIYGRNGGWRCFAALPRAIDALSIVDKAGQSEPRITGALFLGRSSKGSADHKLRRTENYPRERLLFWNLEGRSRSP